VPCFAVGNPTKALSQVEKAKEDEENEDEEVSNVAADLDATYEAIDFSERADVAMEGQTQDITRDCGG
jgi:hypothetical protein